MKGTALFMEDHIARLFNSLIKSGSRISFSDIELYKGVNHLIQSLKLKEGNIKVVWHEDSYSKPFLLVYQTKHFYPEEDLYDKGVHCFLLNESRPDPEIKNWRANFKDNVNMLKEREGVYEIILVNENGIVTEGSQSNLFIIKDNKLYTAFKHNILPGITRKYIFKIARENNIHLEEQDFNIDDLLSSDAVFLTGTSPKVMPVLNIGEKTFNVAHPILKELISLYDIEISNYLKSHEHEI
jgi:branched-chain amino acid aminotransferase